jgi:ribosomal protein S18 acetylase RimI-like enzyme
MRSETHPALDGCIDDEALFLAWSEAPWDSAVLGAPVLQITDIRVHDERRAGAPMSRFESARDAASSPFVSCRLPHDRLRESMLLEERGFRFMEMAFQLEYPDLQDAALPDPGGLSVQAADQADLAWAIGVAGHAFEHERFHVDPRLPRGLGDCRNQNWVRNTAQHLTQRLLVVRDGADRVGFFIVEQLQDGTSYWHLAGIAPERQGQRYGSRSWAAMLHHTRQTGASRVRTSITARNDRVLNLYVRLRFRFSPPAMTFHWLREQ